MIVRAWADPSYDLRMIDEYQPWSIHQNLNAGIYWLTGWEHTAIVMSIYNAFVGVAAAHVSARLAEEMFGRLAGKYTFILAAFLPSMVFWSSLNLKDPLAWLSIVSAVFGVQRLRYRLSLVGMLYLAGGIVVLSFVRPYVVSLVVLGVGLSFAVTRVKQLPYALVVILVVAYAANNIAQFQTRVPTILTLSDTQYLHQGFSDGDSSYGAGTDVSTPRGALLYLPRGLIYYLLSPFPWDVTKAHQALAVPESLMLIFVLLFGLKGMWRGARISLQRVAAPVLVALTITVAYGLVEGNIGTAMRHRAQSLILIFPFVGAEWARRQARGVSAGRDLLPDRAPLLM
jgi:hypothetical protein